MDHELVVVANDCEFKGTLLETRGHDCLVGLAWLRRGGKDTVRLRVRLQG